MAALARFGAVHEYGEWRVDGLSSRVFLVNLVREVVAVSERLRAEVAAADVRERALRDEVAGVRAVATERLVRSLERKPTRDAALLAALEQELSTPLHRVRVARLRGGGGACPRSARPWPAATAPSRSPRPWPWRSRWAATRPRRRC
jgi:signal transduction histidine kinase